MESKVYPALGHVPMNKLQHDARVFQKMIDSIESESGGRTAQYVHMILKHALKRAVSKRLIERNPMEDVARPKAEAKDIRPLDDEEIRGFLKAAKERYADVPGNPYYPLFAFLLDTGCRPGEALALTWTDLDNDMLTVRIQRSLERTEEGWRTKEPKTAGSRRTIELTPNTAVLLKRHRAGQREWMMARRDTYTDHGLIFASQTGEPLDKHNLVQRHFKTTLKAANLPTTVRLYDLRHTCAAQLLKAGVNAKIVAERLGHSSVSMTLNVYSHVLPGMQQVAVSALSRVFAETT